MKAPFFSIVIPVYNRAHIIDPVLASLLEQTFENWEALIVDDGSSDSHILEEKITQLNDPRFQYFKKSNSGSAATRNVGIDKSSGEYIAFLDSDDVFVQDKLEKYFKEISSKDSEKLILFSRFYVDRGKESYWVKPAEGPNENQRIDDYLTCTTGWIQTSTIVIKSSFAKSVRFDEALPSSQDTDFAIRCFLNGATFIFIPECLSVMNDEYDPNRVSKQSKVEPLLIWSQRMLGLGMSKRSYFGYRGWQCARILSSKNKINALGLYLSALVRLTYTPGVAARVFMQIAINQELYQSIMTKLVRLIGKKKF